MPAPKPTTVPDWDTAQLNLLTPPGGQITNGWTNGQVVPSNWLNWFMNLVGQWTDYLRDFELIAHTWSLLQTFSLGIDLAMHRASNVADPVGGQDAATKNYVDSQPQSGGFPLHRSGSSGGFTTVSNVGVPVFPLSVTFTTTGHPVLIMIQPDGSGGTPGTFGHNTTGQTSTFTVLIDGAATVAFWEWTPNVGAGAEFIFPSLVAMYSPPAGAHTFALFAATFGGTLSITDCVLAVKEF